MKEMKNKILAIYFFAIICLSLTSVIADTDEFEVMCGGNEELQILCPSSLEFNYNGTSQSGGDDDEDDDSSGGSSGGGNKGIDTGEEEKEFPEEYSWMVTSINGTSIINFKNNVAQQINHIEFTSGDTQIISVECFPHNDNKNLCSYIRYSQFFDLTSSDVNIQRYDISLSLPDNGRYISKLVFTDENNKTQTLLVRAVPESEFDSDEKDIIEMFGKGYNKMVVAIMIVTLIAVILFFFIDITAIKAGVIIVSSVPVSYLLYLILRTWF